MRRVWILGSGGMLGSAITRIFRNRKENLFEISEPFDWANPRKLDDQFRLTIRQFFAGLCENDHWEIYWACGVGTMSSSEENMSLENKCFLNFLTNLYDQLTVSESKGIIGFASSAGALYAGSSEFEITEESKVAVINAYGRSKLFQERNLQKLALRCSKIKVLIVRFSTLFGPGQDIRKNQGLLTYIARSLLQHRVVEIYVPLDTTRDYLFVECAAFRLINSMKALADDGELKISIKIISAERSVSIAEILSIFSKLTKRRVGVLSKRTSLTGQYPARVAYRSIYSNAGSQSVNRYSFLEGVNRLLNSEKSKFV